MTKARLRVWLDDVRDAPAGWTRAHTGGVVEISLDHDPADDQKFGTGYTVLTWIEEQVALHGSEPPAT